MGRMIIGVDPHKASVTIEVVDEDGAIAARGRFPTDARSYRTLLAYAHRWPHRVWAVEGASGAGRPLAQRLVADGERAISAHHRPSQAAGHVIPAAVTPPHDQRAHSLPPDLNGPDSKQVLTRQPLPEPSLTQPRQNP